MKTKLFEMLNEIDRRGYGQFINGTRKITIGENMIDLLNVEENKDNTLDETIKSLNGKRKNSKKQGLAAKIKDKKKKKELKASKQSVRIDNLKCSVG
jgi:Tfp pilus assembly protein PilZ